MKSISLPYTPRPYQKPFLEFMFRDVEGKRAVLVWHRRAGKDITAWVWTFLASQMRVGAYYYVFPTYAQGRKAIWHAYDDQGRRFLDYIPRELLDKAHDTDMRLHLKNGSLIQLVGSDKVDRIVGPNPVGLVMSEYALQSPKAWQYLSPILVANRGWAVFVYTPRGQNHGWELFQQAETFAKTRPNWFCQRLTVEDTGVVSRAQIDDERASGIPEELIRQEYYCDFLVSLAGTFFGNQIAAARLDGRITDCPYDPRKPVHTAWDFGVFGYTAIWFVQVEGKAVYLIDYYENHSEGLPHYAEVLRRKGYTYGVHLAPHDVSVREWISGMSREEAAAQLGIHFLKVPRTQKPDQIHAGHMLLPRCYFDKTKTELGIKALEHYRREWDEDNRTFRNVPVRDWASHGADAFLTLAMGIDYLDNRDQGGSDYAEGWLSPEYDGRFDPIALI